MILSEISLFTYVHYIHYVQTLHVLIYKILPPRIKQTSFRRLFSLELIDSRLQFIFSRLNGTANLETLDKTPFYVQMGSHNIDHPSMHYKTPKRISL
mmetsp:Transcript_16309/g.21442  ORF Transcript_16309/g.21442 Transcript_16309/m.21442 type:complete len:97 (-) Transcript_16309:335-625(-)